MTNNVVPPPPNPIAQLRRQISDCFNLGELRLLCHDLGIKYDELDSKSLSQKVLSLVTWAEHNERLPTLLTTLQQHRPHITWPTLEQLQRPTTEALPTNPFTAGPLTDSESTLTPCPFVAGALIKDPRLFVGRQAELAALAHRMEGTQPTSINVVGERRIGKSSLLYHFSQTWEQRVTHPDRYIIVFLSLQARPPRHVAAFYTLLLAPLRQRLQARGFTTLAEQLNITPSNADDFRHQITQCQQAGFLPVFCLDEFEQLLKSPQTFDDPFYDQLRGLMDHSLTMFVLASRLPIDQYAQKQNLTSSFLNVAHVIPLGNFDEAEVNEFLQFPANIEATASPALTPQMQARARKWGQRHPYRLQLAAQLLCEVQQGQHDLPWAQRQFKQQVQRLPKKPPFWRRWRRK